MASILQFFLDRPELRGQLTVSQMMKDIVWTAEALKLIGLDKEEPETIVRDLSNMYKYRSIPNNVGSKKVHIYPDPANDPDQHFGSIVGFMNSMGIGGTAAFKNIHRNKNEEGTDASPVRIMMMLAAMKPYDLKTILETTDLSGWRTAIGGTIFLDAVLPTDATLKVFNAGAGGITEQFFQLLGVSYKEKLDALYVNTRGSGAQKLADKLRSSFPMIQAADKSLINPKSVNFLVSNANGSLDTSVTPPVETNVFTLEQTEGIEFIWSNGPYDMPASVARSIDQKGGFFIGDDFDAMLNRNVDPVARWINEDKIDWKNGPKKDRFITLAQLASDPAIAKMVRESKAPKLLSPVGVIDTDIAAAYMRRGRIHAKLVELGFKNDETNSPVPATKE